MSPPAHSLVVCTYNRRRDLQRCLETILPDLGDDELVVIDDGSTDDTPAYLASLPVRANLRLVRVANQGLSANRDLGARLSSAPWITYLDDDAWLPEGWLDHLRAATPGLAPDVALLGGPVSLPWRGARPSWLSPSLRCYLTEFSPSAGELAAPDTLPCVGANMTLRRSWLERVGGFTRGLGRRGGNLLSREETHLWKRLRAAGARGRFDPALWLWHDLPPSRLRRRWFLRRLYWEGISWQIENTPPGGPAVSTMRLRARAARLVLGTTLRLLPRAFLSRDSSARFKAWIDIAFQLGSAVALAKGLRPTP